VLPAELRGPRDSRLALFIALGSTAARNGAASLTAISIDSLPLENIAMLRPVETSKDSQDAAGGGPAPPGRLGALRGFHSRSVLCGVFVWTLTSPKWRFPARIVEILPAVLTNTVFSGEGETWFRIEANPLAPPIELTVDLQSSFRLCALRVDWKSSGQVRGPAGIRLPSETLY
jgi:hypothetical protein